MKKIILLCLLLISACDSGTAPEPQNNAEAVAMMKDLEAAEKEKNWLLALQNADVLMARFPESAEAKAVKLRYDEISKQAQAMQEERRLATLWDYQKVAVGKKTQFSAGIYSKQEMFGGEPTDLPPAARLIIRIHPEWGNSIYLVLAQSKFQCGSPCTMQISFDDGAYKTFPGKQADTGTGPALFIENEKVFYEALQTAKHIKIKVKGVPDLEYEVASYDAGKLGADFSKELK
ncbi:MAG: hypothetical protein ACREO1_02990 [Arenimonas sp.]